MVQSDELFLRVTLLLLENVCELGLPIFLRTVRHLRHIAILSWLVTGRHYFLVIVVSTVEVVCKRVELDALKSTGHFCLRLLKTLVRVLRQDPVACESAELIMHVRRQLVALCDPTFGFVLSVRRRDVEDLRLVAEQVLDLLDRLHTFRLENELLVDRLVARLFVLDWLSVRISLLFDLQLFERLLAAILHFDVLVVKAVQGQGCPRVDYRRVVAMLDASIEKLLRKAFELTLLDPVVALRTTVGLSADGARLITASLQHVIGGSVLAKR